MMLKHQAAAVSAACNERHTMHFMNARTSAVMALSRRKSFSHHHSWDVISRGGGFSHQHRRRGNGWRPYHVEESVAHVALVLEVDRQVEEVVLALELLVYGSEQHLLRVLVGDVLDHERGALVVPCTGINSLEQ